MSRIDSAAVGIVVREQHTTDLVIQFLGRLRGSTDGMLTLSDKRYPGRVIVYEGPLRNGDDAALRRLVKGSDTNLCASISRGKFGKYKTARTAAEYLAYRRR